MKYVFSPIYSIRGEYMCRWSSLSCSRTGIWLPPGSLLLSFATYTLSCGPSTRYIYISGQDRYRVLIPYRSSSILLTDIILYQSFNQFPRRQRNTCLARDTAVHLNTCVCNHSCAAPGRVPDYPRDRCFCRPALRRHPVAHQRDIRIFPVNSVNREIIPNISNRLHR